MYFINACTCISIIFCVKKRDSCYANFFLIKGCDDVDSLMGYKGISLMLVMFQCICTDSWTGPGTLALAWLSQQPSWTQRVSQKSQHSSQVHWESKSAWFLYTGRM